MNNIHDMHEYHEYSKKKEKNIFILNLSMTNQCNNNSMINSML